MHKIVSVIRFLLSFVGGWFILEPLVNFIMLAFSYITNVGRWLFETALRRSYQDACDAGDLAEEYCRNNSGAEGLGAYWAQNTIGVNWGYVVDVLPMMAIGLVLVFLARYAGRWAQKPLDTQADIAVKKNPDTAAAPVAAQMTPGTLASLFVMCCGLFLLLGAGAIYATVLSDVREHSGRAMGAYFEAERGDYLGGAYEDREEIRELEEERSDLRREERDARRHRDRTAERDYQEQISEIDERLAELRGSSPEEWMEQTSEAQEPMVDFERGMDTRAKLGLVLGNIGFLMFLPGLALFLFLRRRQQKNFAATA